MADQINLQDFADKSEFEKPPLVNFDKRASLSIAQQIIWIFAAVLICSFVFLTCLFIWATDTKLDKGIEAVKFLVEAVIPLVTLAVGYYLGDRSSRSRKKS